MGRKQSYQRIITYLALGVLGVTPSSGGESRPEASTGVVVQEVKPGFAGEKAGLQPGDVIFSWSREASLPASPALESGPIRSPFELWWVQTEQAPRGSITLHGGRGEDDRQWILSSQLWEVQVIPELPADLLTLYRAGKESRGQGKLSEALHPWKAAAASVARSGEIELAIWFHTARASTAAEGALWDEVDAAYEDALELADEHSPVLTRIWILLHWGETCLRRNLFDRAQDLYERALRSAELQFPRSLVTATALHLLGNTQGIQDNLSSSEDFFRRSAALYEELAPVSAGLASTLNGLGITAAKRGDLDAAENFFGRSLSIYQMLDPEGGGAAGAWHHLAMVAHIRGDLAAAEERFRRALALREKLGGSDLAYSFESLAILAQERGDLTVAEELLLRSLAIKQKDMPESLDVAHALHNLGRLAAMRGNLETADDYTLRALAIREKVAPGSLDVAVTLEALGMRAQNRGNLTAAEDYLRRALAIYQAVIPEAPEVARTLANLGDVMRERGDLATAELQIKRALEMVEKLAPGSIDLAETLDLLAGVHFQSQNWKEAESLTHRALAIYGKTFPEGSKYMMSLHRLGRILQRTNRQEKAAAAFENAVALFESQRARSGESSDVRSLFATQYRGLYHDYLAAQVGLGRLAEAFHSLERGRARGFLQLLAERDLTFASHLPEGLARDRRSLAAQYDQIQAGLAQLSPGQDDEKIKQLQEQLRGLRARQAALINEIRKSSPRFASLQYPEPFDLAQAQAALDPGTVLLSYSLGEDRSYLFVVEASAGPDSGLSVFTLPVGEKDVREKVEVFRNLLQNPGASLEALRTQGQRLYQDLVEPAERQIRHAERLLISPDGPLHSLSFAALIRQNRYLIDWKPIYTVLSATVWAEIKGRRRELLKPEEVLVAALGDPVYSHLPVEPRDTTEALQTADVRAVIRQRKLSLAPLESTRDEVLGISATFPKTRLFLGPEATEEKAKAIAPQAQILHFACHGLLDERFPLNSGLALTFPDHPIEGQDNGLLQAWEIFEQVRLDADLVTLSACDSGLGQEMGGEGLVGLVRAFQFAGARSVLASLWSVADDSTALLMKRFYTYLRQGQTKDEALRAAQLDLIRSEKSELSHPYHWAGFALYGDWR